jgi:hypothetical protein
MGMRETSGGLFGFIVIRNECTPRSSLGLLMLPGKYENSVFVLLALFDISVE